MTPEKRFGPDMTPEKRFGTPEKQMGLRKSRWDSGRKDLGLWKKRFEIRKDVVSSVLQVA